MDALKYLNQIRKLRYKLDMLKMSCSNAEEAVTQTTSWVTPTSEVHAHRQDAREIALARYVEKKEQMEAVALELELKRNEILTLLERIPDDYERVVLEKFFVYLEVAREISNDTHHSARMVVMLKRRGLASFQKILNHLPPEEMPTISSLLDVPKNSA